MPSRGVAPAVRVKREATAAAPAQPSLHQQRAPAAVKVKTEVKLESAVTSGASSTSRAAGVGGDAPRAVITTTKSQAGRHRDDRVGRRPPRSGPAVTDGSVSSCKREKRKGPDEGGERGSSAVSSSGGQPKRERQAAADAAAAPAPAPVDDDECGDKWEAQYRAFLLFVEVHGHARVPRGFAHNPGKLGQRAAARTQRSWSARQAESPVAASVSVRRA